jgi:signal transduction histidine kinase/CheY-like chemotaxis protein
MWARLSNLGEILGYLAVFVEERPEVDPEESILLAEMASDLAYALRVIKADEQRRQVEKDHEVLQRQMTQAQKMESVGRLAGGVAHDYNNMLTVIGGYAELAVSRAGPDSPLLPYLKAIADAAERSVAITSRLLAFARKQTIRPRIIDLNQVVQGTLQMLERLIGEDIDLRWAPAPRLWTANVDPAQIDQVLANLCVNARDAIDGVGRITIETRNAAFDQAYCARHTGFVPGEYVMLAVSDDGRGMEKEVLEHVFEPFFTTKETGHGTGLGLATVYGIVKQNDGFINVYSEPGHGSSFHIYLPRYSGQAEHVEVRTDEAIPGGHGETVMIVEDEPAILALGETMLKSLGYVVLTAGTPEDALSRARGHDGPIHVVVTDVVLPRMNGRELSQRIRAVKPGVKVLFMSGYTADVIAHRGVLDQGVEFIQKPFSEKDLALKLREVLAGGADALTRVDPAP